MLTIESANLRQAEIQILANEIIVSKPIAYIKDRQYAKLQKEYVLLTDLKIYLKTNDKQEFYEAERDRIDMLLIKIDSEFDLWRSFQKDSKTLEEFKTEYDRIKNVKSLKNQLNIVNYILNQ